MCGVIEQRVLVYEYLYRICQWNMAAMIVLLDTVRMMGCYAKWAVIMRKAILMVMKCHCQYGQEKERQDKDRQPFLACAEAICSHTSQGAHK